MRISLGKSLKDRHVPEASTLMRNACMCDVAGLSPAEGFVSEIY